jgi:hypothetical protein
MTFGKGAALAAGFAGAMALGVWVGPHITSDRGTASVTPHIYVGGSPNTTATATSPSRPRPSASPVRARAATPAIAPTSPDLQNQLKPLLNKGSDMTMASEGFRDAEQFAAVAHASRNTEIPFVLLKHRVLNERKTLSAAIRESKPEMNAELESRRAVAEARSELAKIAG